MKAIRWGHRPAFLAVLVATAMLSGLQAPAARGGNRGMVEQRAEELREVNRQAVSHIPEELPKDGVIELEAEVVGDPENPEIDIQDYSIRRGQIPRRDQTQIGNDAAKAKGGIPRYDPAKQ